MNKLSPKLKEENATLLMCAVSQIPNINIQEEQTVKTTKPPECDSRFLEYFLKMMTWQITTTIQTFPNRRLKNIFMKKNLAISYSHMKN